MDTVLDISFPSLFPVPHQSRVVRYRILLPGVLLRPVPLLAAPPRSRSPAAIFVIFPAIVDLRPSPLPAGSCRIPAVIGIVVIVVFNHHRPPLARSSTPRPGDEGEPAVLLFVLLLIVGILLAHRQPPARAAFCGGIAATTETGMLPTT